MLESGKTMVNIIQLRMEAYRDCQRKRLCERLGPPDFNKLEDVRADATFLTDLNENDDISDAWAGMIR